MLVQVLDVSVWLTSFYNLDNPREVVFKAEEYFTKRGFEPVRVRVHQDLARIEVGADQIEKLVKNHEEINKMMQDLGFLFVTVDLQGYKHGRMNDQLDEKTKKAAVE